MKYAGCQRGQFRAPRWVAARLGPVPHLFWHQQLAYAHTSKPISRDHASCYIYLCVHNAPLKGGVLVLWCVFPWARHKHTRRGSITAGGCAFLFLSGCAAHNVYFLSEGKALSLELSERGRSRLVYFMYHSHASLTLEMHRHAKVRASRKLMRRNKLNQHLGGKKKWERDENVNPRVVHTLARGEGKKLGPLHTPPHKWSDKLCHRDKLTEEWFGPNAQEGLFLLSIPF